MGMGSVEQEVGMRTRSRKRLTAMKLGYTLLHAVEIDWLETLLRWQGMRVLTGKKDLRITRPLKGLCDPVGQERVLQRAN